MSDTAEYDIAPLSWIKTEIDHALQQVYELLGHFKLNEDDPAALRAARTYLHQVRGAVEMVDLPGVALVCLEMEHLTEALEHATVEITREVLDLLQDAGHIVEHYLDELLKDKPNLQLSLFPVYQQLRAARGITETNASDLFFPDMNCRAPSNDSAVDLNPDERIQLIKKSRVVFQRGLLDFLRQQNADQGLSMMRNAVSDMEIAMTASAGRTFWWGASAFVDCLINHSIEPTFAVKQLCARIDLQMRRHIEGSHKIAERLLRDLLYFVAQSLDVNERVIDVKKTFNLRRLIPNPIDTSKEIRDLRYALKKVLLTLNNAKEFWIKFASGHRPSLPGFQTAVNDLQAQTTELNNTQITRLINEIQGIANDFTHLPPERYEAINLEVATTLLLLQNNLEHYEDISGELLQQVQVQSQRLRAAAYSENNLADIVEIPLLDEISRQAQEKLLMAQVAQEIQLNIQKIEEGLDSFFRDALHDRQLISGLNRPLTEIQGALSIMQLDAAAQILQRTHGMIDQLVDPAIAINESIFPIIADAVSSISLYVEAQRYNRPEALHLLQPILIQLGLVEEVSVANPTSFERIEDELQTLDTELYYQLEAWQNLPDKETSKKQIVNTLNKISQDVELIGDVPLKRQIEDLLAQLRTDNDHAALAELARKKGIPVPGSAITDTQPIQPTEEIDAELLGIFLEEAGEVLATITSTLEIITRQTNNLDALRTLRRSYHTLKGSGRMVGLNELGETAWAIEQLLNLWLQDENTATTELLVLLESAYSVFSSWIGALQKHAAPVIDYPSLIAQADQLRLTNSGNTAEATGPITEISPTPVEIEPTTGTDGPIDVAATLPPAEAGYAIEPLNNHNAASLPTAPPALEHHTIPSMDPDSSDAFYTSIVFDTDEDKEVATASADTTDDLGSAEYPNDGGTENNLVDDYGVELTDERIAIGTNLISPMLLDIFSREASQHYQTLRDEFERRLQNREEIVSYEFMRAAHTLAGIAGLTGFSAVADLAHALESWLNRLHNSGSPLPDNDLATDSAITQIGRMLESINQQQSPVAVPDLIEQLGHAQISIPTPPDDTLIADAMDIGDIATTLPEFISKSPADPEFSLPDTGIVHAEPTLDTLLLPNDSSDQQHKVTDDVDEQLLPIFLEEANDLLPEIEKSVRNWRQEPNGEEQTNIQRLLHTLKGSARMAGAMQLGELTHTLETEVVEAINKHQIADTDFDRFETELDQLNNAIEQLRNPPQPVPVITAADGIIPDRRKHAPPVADMTAALAIAPENEAGMQTLRVRAETVDRLVNEAGEINITRSRLESSVTNIRLGTVELNENLQRLRTQLRELEIQAESQMQSNLSHRRNEDAQFDPLEFDRFTRLQELTRMIAESVNDIGTVQQNLAVGLNETDAAITQQGRLAKDLQQALMHIRMVPLASISDRLHRTVRLAAKDLGKKASLQLVGAHVEFDRGILDKIVAPLEHLLRNSVAHGIEMPQERITANKSEYGEIVLYTRQEGNEIIIALRDDGHGLDLDAIRSKAIENGLIEASAEIPVEELMQLIFASGFSTAESITTLSGRGIGMDVVKNEITQLGGRIDLASEIGKGIQFSIYLPLTLAVTQTVMVTISDRKYAIPSASVEQVQEYKTERLQELLAAKQISWQTNHYDFFYLPHLLGETHKQPITQTYSPVLLLRSGNQRVAILVDHLTGNQEVVVKNIGPQLARVLGIAGATVMGNGEIVLILNPVQLAQRQGPLVRSNIPTTTAIAATPDRPVIMVVDDSLTVRKIASRMLNREGYEVITAKDGIDALQLLQNTLPEIMLLDIEMPRMDGFELTKVMRADHKMANIPIIMITSRTADKHREHAFSLGVNAYLGKPYQDELLLEKIRELSGAKAIA